MASLPVFAPIRRLAGSRWSDAALIGVVALAQTWPLLLRDSDTGRPWDWWGYVATAGSALPLLWRRRAPVPVVVLCIAFGSSYDLVHTVPPQPLWYAPLIAIYGLAARSRPAVRLTVFTVLCCAGLATVGSTSTAVRGVVVYVTAYALGRAAAGSRAQAAVLEERAARLERDRRLDAERAAERERARIARDMHDVLAHSISLMVVQAEAGPVVLGSAPDRAAAAFDAIAGTGRDALGQLRRMLAVLKDEDGPRAPQPTLDDLPALAAQVSGAGLRVGCSAEGEPRPLPADCGVAAYRIAQEALTNVVKHAGAGTAEIRLRWADDALTISVVDDGRGAGTGLPSGGNGLIGIRERAAACGGTATAGPRPDGPGFAVSARLPLAGAAA
ncbi:sensor histidine kinase [Actinomadura verrucosospora]|uniref:histidine kinase n=1 Tax=Actinomadura verrucosospora TaxID=46165 RepID=A0A7D3ZRT8_ACTVE|nr:sensor histidine kinase [Actinomadura verrucosospora]QKG25042.1 two-component system sensor kinase [Actinomadura verrucosospora]